ncbi:hypothetical protein Ancab_025289 [Ancistrocladus abbreviatus]
MEVARKRREAEVDGLEWDSHMFRVLDLMRVEEETKGLFGCMVNASGYGQTRRILNSEIERRGDGFPPSKQ